MQERAHADGWALVTTIENKDSHPVWDIVRHGPKFATDRDAWLAVLDAAKRHGALHQHALKLVTQSRVRLPTEKKK